MDKDPAFLAVLEFHKLQTTNMGHSWGCLVLLAKPQFEHKFQGAFFYFYFLYYLYYFLLFFSALLRSLVTWFSNLV